MSFIVGFLIGGMCGVLTVSLFKVSCEDKEKEDEEQMEYLAKWREEKGRVQRQYCVSCKSNTHNNQ